MTNHAGELKIEDCVRTRCKAVRPRTFLAGIWIPNAGNRTVAVFSYRRIQAYPCATRLAGGRLVEFRAEHPAKGNPISENRFHGLACGLGGESTQWAMMADDDHIARRSVD